jgi:hypothetical protein
MGNPLVSFWMQNPQILDSYLQFLLSLAASAAQNYLSPLQAMRVRLCMVAKDFSIIRFSSLKKESNGIEIGKRKNISWKQASRVASWVGQQSPKMNGRNHPFHFVAWVLLLKPKLFIAHNVDCPFLLYSSSFLSLRIHGYFLVVVVVVPKTHQEESTYSANSYYSHLIQFP